MAPMSSLQVIIAYGTMDIGHGVARAKQVVARGKQTLVLGLTRSQRDQGRGAWVVCLSWQGESPIWVSAHPLRRDAEWQLLRAQEVAQARDLTSATTRMELRNELARYGDRDLADVLAHVQALFEQ